MTLSVSCITSHQHLIFRLHLQPTGRSAKLRVQSHPVDTNDEAFQADGGQPRNFLLTYTALTLSPRKKKTHPPYLSG